MTQRDSARSLAPGDWMCSPSYMVDRPADRDRGSALQLVTARPALRLGQVIIDLAGPQTPPQVDAVVHEEDSFLVLSAARDLALPLEHPVRTHTRALEAEPLAPGTVVLRRGTPLALLAVVHDLDQRPSCREPWVRAALREVLSQAQAQGVAALATPLLGATHGALPAVQALDLLLDALEAKPPARPLVVWLQVRPRDHAAVTAALAERARRLSPGA